MSAVSSPPQILSIIAAVGRNGGIGFQGRLPWRLPGDLRHFRALTLGKPVIMGRRTYLSLGAPLSGRDNIVLSSDPDWRAAGVQTASDLTQALQLAADCTAEEAMIIGGARLYEEALPVAQRLYLTEVDAAPAADAFFPDVVWSDWKEVESRAAKRLPEDEYAYRFRTLERRA